MTTKLGFIAAAIISVFLAADSAKRALIVETAPTHEAGR